MERTWRDIEHLPIELLREIFQHLSTRDRLSCAAVCRRWMRLLGDHYAAHVVNLIITFEESACEMRVEPELRLSDGNNAYALQLYMCQCEGAHVARHRNYLLHLMQLIAVNLKQLIIEDCFILKRSFIATQTFEAVLGALCGQNQLNWLEMHNVDLSNASTRCLRLVGRMHNLGQLSMVQCSTRLGTPYSFKLNDTILAAMVRPDAIEQLKLTATPVVSDRLLLHIARTCPLLWFLNLSGCKNVTARGIAAFCETLHNKQADTVWINLRDCPNVRGEELQHALLCERSPAYKRGPWQLTHVNCFSVYGAETAARAFTPQAPHKQLLMIST